MQITIDLQGDKELMRKLKRIENPARIMRKGLENFINDERKTMEEYAPATQANRRPGVNGYSWYVRGVGTHTITGKVYTTSQDMRARWNVKITRYSGGVRATIQNKADYSGYVIGKKQVWFHKKRGWINVPEHLEKRQGRALDEIGKEVNKELRR